MPVGDATTVEPSYTRYPVAPADADQPSEIEVPVVPVTVRPPGVGGAVTQPVVVTVTPPDAADSPAELYAVTVYVWVEQVARLAIVAEAPVGEATTVLPSRT